MEAEGGNGKHVNFTLAFTKKLAINHCDTSAMPAKMGSADHNDDFLPAVKYPSNCEMNENILSLSAEDTFANLILTMKAIIRFTVFLELMLWFFIQGREGRVMAKKFRSLHEKKTIKSLTYGRSKRVLV